MPFLWGLRQVIDCFCRSCVFGRGRGGVLTAALGRGNVVESDSQFQQARSYPEMSRLPFLLAACSCLPEPLLSYYIPEVFFFFFPKGCLVGIFC